MDRLKILILLFFCSCHPFYDDDYVFRIRNQLTGDMNFNSFNLDGSGFAGEVIIVPNEEWFTGGGGILDVDSVLFIRKSDSDTIIYRNARHGGDLTEPNHFFNLDNWVEEDTNKFFYNVKDEDFD